MNKLYILFEDYSDNGYKTREAYSTLEKATEGMEKWIESHYFSDEERAMVRKERLLKVESILFKR